MKANIFFLIVALAFSTVLCNSSLAGEMPEEEKSMDHQLYVMGSRNYILEDDSGPLGYAATAKLIPPEELAFTEDDILSYNPTTKEIVFIDSIFYKLLYDYPIFSIYFNDTLLSENVAQMREAASFVIKDLVLYLGFYDKKFYLCFTNPWWNLDAFINYYEDITEEQKEALDALQKRFEKRKAELDILIQYLSDAGKIYTGTEEIKPELPVQIYSSDKTIYVNNRSDKTGIVTVYRIDGLKVMERAMVSQTTTLEIPAVGFYLVSVKAGNEKPVTAKVIVR